MEAGRFGEGRKTFLRSKEGGRTLRRLPLVGGHFFRWHDQKVEIFPGGKRLKDASASRLSAVTPFRWHDQKVEIFPGGKRLKDASASRWSAVTPFRWHDQKVEIFPGGKRLKDVAPPVGRRSPFSVARPKLVLDSGGLLMEATGHALERKFT